MLYFWFILSVTQYALVAPPPSFFTILSYKSSFIYTLGPPLFSLSRSACHCEVCVGSIVIGIDVPPKRDLQEPFEKISLMENSR